MNKYEDYYAGLFAMAVALTFVAGLVALLGWVYNLCH